MANAYDTYTSLRADTARGVAQSVPEALREARFLLNRVQHQVLAAQPDGIRRQLCGILFTHATQSFELADIYDAPEAWTQRDAAPDRRGALRTAAITAALILFVLCCVELYYIHEILLLVGLSLAAILVLAAVVTRPRPGRERIHLTQRVSPERLDAYLAARMRAIDRDMDALDLLLPTDTHGTGDEALDIVAKVLEIDSARIDPVPPAIRHAADALLVRQGITLVDYTEENAPLFQSLPTQRSSRTLVPAMLRDGHLIRQGLAIQSVSPVHEEVH